MMTKLNINTLAEGKLYMIDPTILQDTQASIISEKDQSNFSFNRRLYLDLDILLPLVEFNYSKRNSKYSYWN